MSCILTDKTILLLGGTGSFGQAFTEIALRDNPRSIRVFSRGEYLQSEMQHCFHDERLRFFIGDIRDPQRLHRAMMDVDIVVYAAALKQVPAVEYNPREGVLTNVMGSLNIIDAAIDNEVPKVIALSSDKACLSYHSPVELFEGGTVKIRDMVVAKGTAAVKTLGPRGFTKGKVIGWHDNPLGGRTRVQLRLKNPQSTGAAKSHGLILTEEHLVMTPRGWKRAGALKNGDLVVTSEACPNSRQRKLLVGTLLGDASIGCNRFGQAVKNNYKAYMTVGHSEKQLEWLWIKYNALKEFACGAPRLERPGSHGGEKRAPFYILRLRALRYFADLHEQFYQKDVTDDWGRYKKALPRKLIEESFSPEMLAAWYMDDGTYVPNGGRQETATIRLETQGYCEEDVKWLAALLTDHGFPALCYAHKVSGRVYYQIRIHTEVAKAIFNLIGSFVPSALRYKLPSWAPKYNPELWNLGCGEPFVTSVTVEAVKPPKQDVYCLDIEGTHNFCAGGFVVHNCQPLNTYGATKLVMEKLLVQANVYSQKTRFACTRYGNVVGSRGSVLQVFREQAKQGTLTLTDARMSRFWLTLERGVNFVLASLEMMQGGEIFVPKLPSVRLIDVARAVAPQASLVESGVRPGEKLREILITEEESRRAKFYGTYFIIEPEFKFWTTSRAGGEPLPDGFCYASDTNPWSLSPEAIKQLMGGAGDA